MAKRSLGHMSKRSRTLRKKTRETVGISSIIKEFKKGEKVSIHPKPSYPGMPHPRYRGRTGEVLGKRGKSYLVELMIGNSKKKLIVPPVHLR